MKTKAILMTLAMMSAALAGCTGSDGVTEIDDETLQQLFDDNIQDFMNNTSVTVNQEIHYHNNTTVNNYETTNEYNNTTSVDGGMTVVTTRPVPVLPRKLRPSMSTSSIWFVLTCPIKSEYATALDGVPVDGP